MPNLTPWRRRPDPVALLEQSMAQTRELREVARVYAGNNEILQERLAELELGLEDVGWDRLNGQMQNEFSRGGLGTIITLSRLMALKNPLVKRGILVQLYYVFAQGVAIQARDEDVNVVVQDFLDDPDNRAEFSGHQARMETAHELGVTGNLLMALFTTPKGGVKVRSIPIEEIEDIILDPNDRRRPLYYVRAWQQSELDPVTGKVTTKAKRAYYPDWRHALRTEAAGEGRPMAFGPDPIEWEAPIYHRKVGGLRDMRFGIPESYAGLDWARAYKSFLEDFATVSASLARFAWQLSGAKSARQVASWKTRLGTGVIGDNTAETNPPPGAGSIFASTTGALAPVRTSGATTGPDEARELKLMHAASDGLPETFYGDTDAGTLATAKSLDRPTELKFRDRQAMWSEFYTDLCTYAVYQAIKAGTLSGWKAIRDDDQDLRRIEGPAVDGKPQVLAIDVVWPPILEHDVASTVTAIVDAATLKGQTIKGMPPKMFAQLIYSALGVQDADEWVTNNFPDGEGEDIPEPDPMPTDPAAIAQQTQQQPGQPPRPRPTTKQAQEAVRILRTLLLEGE